MIDNAQPVARELITKSRLVGDLRALGLPEYSGSAVMVHTRMSDLGWVVGGAQVVVEAILEATRGAALLVFTGWQDRPTTYQDAWDAAERDAYRLEAPAFDPKLARAEVHWGRIPEAVRTWPGASHSIHPVCAFAAIGRGAHELVASQSLVHGFGADSPLERIVEVGGAVLLLGDLFASVTLLHYAEHLAAVAEKRYQEFEMPVLVDGERVWMAFKELNGDGALPYERVIGDKPPFSVITPMILEAGIGTSGAVGNANAHLLPARGAVDFARAWMERHFN